MILPYFEELARGLEQKLAAAAPGQPVARKTLALEIARLGARLFSGREPVAWCGVLAPFDLLQAMGVTSCFVEFVGAMLASSGAVTPMLDRAEQAGFSTDGCSYHRAVIGATLQGLMPRPEFLVATSAPCTGGLAVIENLARHFERDLFVIDVPQRADPRSVDYLARQLEALVGFVAAHRGEELDPARLADAVARTNAARAVLVEVYELCRARPSPTRRRDMVNLGLVLSLLLGSETAVEIARTYRDELATKVRAGNGSQEQIRLLWLQNRIQFKTPLEQTLEEQHRAVVVADELNAITWEPIDPADPFRSMARRMLSIPLVGEVERRLDHLRRMARDYAVDGAINPCHWGCRQGTGARGLTEAGLRAVGVPVLNLEVDCIDARHFAPGQLATRLEAFVELIWSRRAARRS